MSGVEATREAHKQSAALGSCPLCGNGEIEEIGRQTISVRDDLDDRRKLRLQIFLEDWARTEESSFQIRWCRCECCGFTYYLPRPTVEMVSRKYQRLSTRPLRQPPFPDRVEYDPEAWQQLRHRTIYLERARELFQLLSPWVSAGTKMLDFGGAQGAIMEMFVKDGMDCHVVDYGCRSPLPGVYYRGPSLDGVEAEYDLAICNHVLEHVADPVGELASVWEALRNDGLIFVEVPMELWNKTHPTPSEPVTHINWFSVPSLRYALGAAGFRVLTLGYSCFRTYGGTKAPAVRAVARKAEGPVYSGDAGCGVKSELAMLRDIQKGRLSGLLENFFSLTLD